MNNWELNLDEAKIKRNRGGVLVMTGKFREPIPNLIIDEFLRHFQANIERVKVQINSPYSFQVFHLRDSDIDKVGHILGILTKPKPTLLQKILMDLDQAEKELGFRK